MSDLTDINREYQREWRQKHKPSKTGKPRQSYLDQRNVLTAFAEGILSEGQASQLLGLDRVAMRTLHENAVRAAEAMWARWRKVNPAETQRGAGGRD